MYALIKDNKIVEFPIYDIRERFPNTSFPIVILQGHLPEGYVLVEYSQELPEYDVETHIVDDYEFPKYENDKWVAHRKVRKLTEYELEQRRLDAVNRIRSIRNELLRDTDWTQLTDSPITKEDAIKWKEYRQELRDITKQPQFPFNVQFPEIP